MFGRPFVLRERRARRPGTRAPPIAPARPALIDPTRPLVFELALACAALLAGIWLGYPLVVAALARLRRAPFGAVHAAPPRVTAIVATREGTAAVRARVADLLRTAYPLDRLDVVVGVDGDAFPEGLPAVDGGVVRVTVVPADAPGGKASALNAAVREATGEILVFTDIAQSFEPETIPRLVQSLANARFAAVSGALHTAEDGRSASGVYWMLERWLRSREGRLHSTIGVTGAVYALRRSHWTPLPAGLILDDLFVPMRAVLAGARVGFRDDARAWDDRTFAHAQEYRRKARTLTGVLQLCAWMPDVLVPWRNPAWAQFVCHKLLRLLTPYLLIVGAVAGAWASARWLAAAVPSGGVLVALAASGAVLVVAAVPRLRALASGVLGAQLAVMRATYNGFRGRWDVWSR